MNRKVGCAAVLVLVTILGSGCGGINASQGVSPASFLLPGLMQADPKPVEPAPPVPEAAPGVQVAQLK